MFKKIVSQLSFSPALVGQLGFYARRLRKEQATRRMGLVFVALALVVQSLVVFQAPEPANASNQNDFIVGGLGTGSQRSLNKFLAPYDRNDKKLKDIMNYFGITRAEIKATKFTTFKVANQKSYGFENRAGSKAIDITNANYDTVKRIYGRPMTVWEANKPGTPIYAYVGHSKKAGWFAIMQVCGNLVTKEYPSKPTPPPAPAKITASKSAVNTSQKNINATKSAAKVNDKITYKVSVKNSGGTAKMVKMSDNIGEVLKYAKLTNKGGGTLTNNRILSWGSVKVNPGKTVTKTYTVQMKSSLISTTDRCSMRNSFIDKEITVPVKCSTPPAKIKTSKTVVNVSQGNIDATKTTAKKNDRIVFTVTATNSGGTAKEFLFEDNIGDALEYATLVDKGGATYDASTRVLSWPKVTIKPKETQVRTFTMQIKENIPATPRGTSDPSSYDCRIENAFYTSSVMFPVECAVPKEIIEQVVPELPKTGPRENMLFAGIVLSLATFFYLRSRQLNKEVRLIRRDLNGGTI